MEKLEKPKKSKCLCSGCHDNFYNGNNDYGVEKCWHFGEARVVKALEVGLDQPPPYGEYCLCYVLSCYKKRGCAFIKNPSKIKRGTYKGQYTFCSESKWWDDK